MKTPIQKTLTRILTLCALSASALNVLAENKVVLSGTVIDPGPASYEAVSGTAALLVGAAFYSGTHITLSGTFASGNARYGAHVQGGGTLALHDSVIASTIGVRVEHAASVFQFNDLTVRDALTGFDTSGIITGTGLWVTASSMGIYQSGGRVEIERFAIDVSGGVNATGATYNSSVAGGTMSLTSGTITVRADDARGLLMLGYGMNAFLTDVHISTSGSRNLGVDIYTDGGQIQNLVMRGGSIQTDGGEALHITGRGIVTVDLQDTDMAGDITATGSAHSTITLDHGTLTGGIIASGSSALAFTGSNGIVISGTVSGNDHAVIDLTVSGPGGSFTGDLAQNDDASVTLAITDSAAGRGAWDGGNLNLGGGSQWDFTDHSRLNHGHNSGALNLGDYKVIFDNLTHTGTLNLHINSDTGEGGSIAVTGTADGEGRVHIDTTGNGQADPNKVLPDVVKGDGTENWQWDPIDWGIDTVIKDGDHFIKQGTSPVGDVLNSAIAVQQAMWFAQQNSLLKRMGELRYGTRASRPQAGGTPALHIIDNIWLRSYGQQLNVGSKVAGKAYEQLIYGVDVGTDHKFTLSADSDLYLGVYAGYGRSDIDYRTPGTDGELNSYYGGLYATWLHSSGFYIDATFKAASVDNNLKAPYGATQLTANYSDVNIGGSIEIGRKFTFTDDWFIEPQFQVNYLHILAEDYNAGPMSITASDLDALQLRLGSLFGRTINLTNGGALQPYIKISGVETISSGGTLHNGYQHTRANTDGARAELGAGLIWQLDADNQLHLDYEASFGDKYDKPWGLTAGYRHQF